MDSLTEVPTTEDKLVGKAEGLVKVLASGSAFAPSADMYKALWEKMYRDANYFVAAESWPKSKEQNVDVGTMNRQFGFALNMANELNPNTDDGTTIFGQGAGVGGRVLIVTATLLCPSLTLLNYLEDTIFFKKTRTLVVVSWTRL